MSTSRPPDLVARWAASGAMALTGFPGYPLGPPEPLVAAVEELGRRLPGLHPLALLGERAVFSELGPHGTTSCGGSCRLLPTRDGWIAVSLPRPDDVDAVPAWLELEHPYPAAEAVWPAVADAVKARSTDDAVARAVLLGLPVAAVGESIARTPVVPTRLGAAPPRALGPTALVVDLSVMWAGPLCGDLLARAGATVLKVESTSRPDGARRGPAGFFDLLNGAKQSVALDFTDRGDVRRLHELLRQADIVIEAARPRALAQLGIDAVELVESGGPQVWVSITGYGRDGAEANRVAFGDDAAAAGGLVCMAGSTPVFCADAIADPVTGLAAVDACLHALETGDRWLLDVSMSAVSARLAGPTLAVPPGIEVAPPRARPVIAPAPALGVHTAGALRELGVRA